MNYRYFAASIFLAALTSLASEHADAAWLSEPEVSVSGSCSEELILRMELEGYEDYGAGDGRADVIYSGESGTWTFEDLCRGTSEAHLRLLVALDDRYEVPVEDYELEVRVNGRRVASGDGDKLGLRHGAPQGERFNNWAFLLIRISPADRYEISVRNRSDLSQEHWIAIDSISLYLRE
ncbi:MAG: hypothetical protein R6X02_01015 [Enhygromyxa sp.]